MIKSVHVIVNPASGRPEPILFHLNRVFGDAGINWRIFVTKKSGDAAEFARFALNSGVDALVVYGGDGTVAEVAPVLYRQELPLGILSGGTANIVAKELYLPLDLPEALRVIAKPAPLIRRVDMMLVNDEYSLIRLNSGVFSSIVTQNSRTQKNKLGLASYLVAAASTLMESPQSDYTLHFDHQFIRTSGVGLMIANFGHIGFSGYTLAPDIDITDGRLDVLVLKQSDLSSIISLAGGALTGTTPPVLEHWQTDKIELTINPPQELLLDDHEIIAEKLTIKNQPHALKILV